MPKREPTPVVKTPGTVISKSGTGLRKPWHTGPTSFRGSGDFSSNGFKSKDANRAS